MIRRVFILVGMLALIVYVILGMTAFNGKPDNEVCQGMNVSIKDTTHYSFINYTQIKHILERQHLSPIGKRRGDINVRQLEETLSRHPFISKAECYLTSGNKVAIEIYQRIPILHVLANNGDNYYLDHQGRIMNFHDRAVCVPVATGAIDRKFAKASLYPLAQYLQTDRFWNSQIEQIFVNEAQELELVPRVGSQTLFFGKADDFNEKFRKLRTFYTEGLSQAGWNKYSRISVEFGNQIICTKKEQ